MNDKLLIIVTWLDGGFESFEANRFKIENNIAYLDCPNKIQIIPLTKVKYIVQRFSEE